MAELGLPIAPTITGKAVVAHLDTLYPKCHPEAKRQGFAPFSCKDPHNPAPCDQRGKCHFYAGLAVKAVMPKNQFLFVGWTKEPEDTILLWFALLPAQAMATRKTSVDEFYWKLNSGA